MRTKEHVTIAILKYGLIFVLWIGLSVAEKLKAQDNEKDWDLPRISYTGIEASLGFKQSALKSSIPELNGMSLLEEGGNIGAIFGSSFSRFVVRPFGMYSASTSIGRTINLFALEAENNTYIIRGLTQKEVRLDVYSLLGVNFSSYKFFGHYVNEDLRPTYNNKSGREPYLGKIESLMMTAGLGLEYRLVNDLDFVHVYLAGKYQLPMQISSDSEAFKDTGLNRNFDLTLGVRFGIMKQNKFAQEILQNQN